jgi:hypothetical protein
MNIHKTSCVCCPNAIEFAKGHGLLTISNWRNAELTAMYSQHGLPKYSDDGKQMFVETIYKLKLGLWMFSLTLTGNKIEPFNEGDEFPGFDEKDKDLGQTGAIMWTPPFWMQSRPEFGDLGFSFSFDYAGFSCDPNYETNIGINAALGLAYLGSACIYYWWELVSRRVHPAAQYMGPKAVEQIAKYMMDPNRPK